MELLRTSLEGPSVEERLESRVPDSTPDAAVAREFDHLRSYNGMIDRVLRHVDGAVKGGEERRGARP